MKKAWKVSNVSKASEASVHVTLFNDYTQETHIWTLSQITNEAYDFSQAVFAEGAYEVFERIINRTITMLDRRLAEYMSKPAGSTFRALSVAGPENGRQESWGRAFRQQAEDEVLLVREAEGQVQDGQPKKRKRAI